MRAAHDLEASWDSLAEATPSYMTNPHAQMSRDFKALGARFDMKTEEGLGKYTDGVAALRDKMIAKVGELEGSDFNLTVKYDDMIHDLEHAFPFLEQY